MMGKIEKRVAKELRIMHPESRDIVRWARKRLRVRPGRNKLFYSRERDRYMVFRAGRRFPIYESFPDLETLVAWLEVKELGNPHEERVDQWER